MQNLKSTIIEKIESAIAELKKMNPDLAGASGAERGGKLRKVLVANRGEIAKRFFLSLHEERIPSVAVVTDVDRGQSWYEFADEVVFIGAETNYVNIPVVIAAAAISGANAIYSGYGFLSENASFVGAIDEYSNNDNKIIFMGPNEKTMRLMGDKVSSRTLAKSNNVPLFASTEAFENPDINDLKKQIAEIGYPVIVKLSAGGGGKGMYPVFREDEVEEAVTSCMRIGKDLYGDARFYIEQFIQEPVHIEVQVFNDRAVGIRKCAVQRRNQKIIEESGHTFLPDHQAMLFLSAAERLALVSGYGCCGAGTVEFLIDSKNGKMGFMEMNTRLQVEYGVTDQSLGIDLVKWQILYFDGRAAEIGDTSKIKYKIENRKHSVECRIYAEEPENDYRPSPGTISEINLPSFNGIRCDFGFGEGDRILSMYDPMIGKLIAWGDTRDEALIRMERALQELYIKGVKTNVNQLLRVMRHDSFRNPDYTNSLIPENPALGFKEIDIRHVEASQSKRHIVFGAYTEYLKMQFERARNFIVVAASRGILDTEAKDIPYRFTVECEGERFGIEFLQCSLNESHVFVNGSYQGKITMTEVNDRHDDFVIAYQSATRRVRVEKSVAFTLIRMRDDTNRIDYYRMSITPEGVAEADTTGHVVSPFQGTFVSFCGSFKQGDKVKKGDRLVILSAMKMESIIQAPVDGTISYILENGDASRLVVGTTADGRVIGKSVKEGEIIFRIEPVKDEKSAAVKAGAHFDVSADSTNAFELLLLEKGETKLLADIDPHFDDLLELFNSMVKGFIVQEHVIERLKLILNTMPGERWKALMTRDRSDLICNLILHYTCIKRLFSFEISSEGFSFPDELDHFLRRWDKPDVELSESFTELVNDLFTSYDHRKWAPGSAHHFDNVSRLLYYIKLSEKFCGKHWNKIGKQVNIVGSLDITSPSTVKTISRLFTHTSVQMDDSSERFIKRVVEKLYPDKEADLYAKLHDDHTAKETPGSEIARATQSVPEEYRPLLPALANVKWVEKERLAFAEENNSLVLFFLPSEQAFVSYENFIGELKRTLAFAEGAFGGGISRFEIVLSSSPASTIPLSDFLTLIAKPVHHYVLKKIIPVAIVRCHNTGELADGTLVKISSYRNKASLDILHRDDPSNPYGSVPSEGDRKMYELGKWPLERWAELLFDGSSMSEVSVEGVDDPAKPVGAKIFTGTISGENACFYMKDFRVIGGATGNREGLKFSAACYLSYMKGWPLYVWNDSAGANIKEGMVSLNRGGQGFMMNSLLSTNAPFEKFKALVHGGFDEEVKKVCAAVDRAFGLSLEKGREGSFTMMVAIGTGASAGLDVYGSSQATVQIILDSENSYRVLTGSNVIKSVMGEDISNYDIGGAVILGKLTGIVDLVARDKIDMLEKVRAVHLTFTGKQRSEKIARSTMPACRSARDKYNKVVIDVETIRANVDGGNFFEFKKEYYASNALIGGFGKLAGQRALILGARTISGLRSVSAVVKARELLRMAYRTATPQILVYGDEWAKTLYLESNLRAYYDFMQTLNARSSYRVHIVTSVKALQNFEITSSADAVIFVAPETMSDFEKVIAEKNATFIVDCFDAAFDYAARIFTLLENRAVAPSAPSGKISVPADKAVAFEIKSSVIDGVADKDTFVEFFAPFNRPAGPNLVTGLARINGMTVGIIADQPQIKGGGADAFGTEKFRVFTQFVNRMKLPLLMLSNSSGFVPGSQQERYRIQAIGADSLDENILGEIPVCSVVLNQNYGGRQIHAFSKSLRPGIRYIALENATMAVMGAAAAFDLLGARQYTKLAAESKDKADAYQKAFIDEYNEKALAKNDALATGVLDSVVKDASKLRDHIVDELDRAIEEVKLLF